VRQLMMALCCFFFFFFFFSFSYFFFFTFLPEAADEECTPGFPSLLR
jgi:hypothetical protein